MLDSYIEEIDNGRNTRNAFDLDGIYQPPADWFELKHASYIMIINTIKTVL